MTTDSSLAPAVCDPACGPEVARDFLEALFADAVGPQARLVIFTAPGEEHRRFEDIDDAARYAASRAGAVNVYFGVGLIGGAPPGRGKAARQDFIYNNFEAKGIQPFKNALPEKYGDSNGTPLSCSVKGRMTVKFELTTK